MFLLRLLRRADLPGYVWFTLGFFFVVSLGLLLLIRSAPTAKERFESCMALAEQAGLLEERRDDAALICLERATARAARERGPRTGLSLGGQPILIP